MFDGAWMVRVKHNKVSVGIFVCDEVELADLVDEVCEPDACECKPLPSGGFIFGGEVVLHQIDEDNGESPHFSQGHVTDGWYPDLYEDAGDWRDIQIAIDGE